MYTSIIAGIIGMNYALSLFYFLKCYCCSKNAVLNFLRKGYHTHGDVSPAGLSEAARSSPGAILRDPSP
jgi:hypothetical protein